MNLLAYPKVNISSKERSISFEELGSSKRLLLKLERILKGGKLEVATFISSDADGTFVLPLSIKAGKYNACLKTPKNEIIHFFVLTIN